MRYLVDECLGRLVVTKLQDAGHDVEWVRDGAEGTPDETVLEWSVRTERVLVTEDFDYGELIFAKGHPAFGVVILQLSGFPGSWEDVSLKAVERLIDKPKQLRRSFNSSRSNAHKTQGASCSIARAEGRGR